MKKLTLLLVTLTLFTSTAVAQSTRDEIFDNPLKAGGVYFPYSYTAQKYTPAPKGYQPVYLSHYGRHGSRYILKDEEIKNVMKTLKLAHNDSRLTAQGEEVYRNMRSISEQMMLRSGDLTPLGQQQHHQIAERMYRNFPTIFRRSPQIEMRATIIPRVIMSMAACSEQLRNLDPKLEITEEASRRFMRYLNPYFMYNRKDIFERNIELRFPKGAWVKDWYAFSHRVSDYRTVAARLFTDVEYAQSKCDLFQFVYDLYHNAVCLEGTPIEERLADVFTTEELFNLWRCDNAIYYFEKGNSQFAKGYLSEITAPLLKNFLDSADECLQKERPQVTLRFGHDGVLMGLYSYMELKPWNCQMPGDDMEHLHEYYRSYDIPMAANMQLIFYKKKGSDDVLVKLLLNECEAQMPFTSDCAPYYHWKEVEQYYRAKLAKSKLL